MSTKVGNRHMPAVAQFQVWERARSAVLRRRASSTRPTRRRLGRPCTRPWNVQWRRGEGAEVGGVAGPVEVEPVRFAVGGTKCHHVARCTARSQGLQGLLAVRGQDAGVLDVNGPQRQLAVVEREREVRQQRPVGGAVAEQDRTQYGGVLAAEFHGQAGEERVGNAVPVDEEPCDAQQYPVGGPQLAG